MEEDVWSRRIGPSIPGLPGQRSTEQRESRGCHWVEEASSATSLTAADDAGWQRRCWRRRRRRRTQSITTATAVHGGCASSHQQTHQSRCVDWWDWFVCQLLYVMVMGWGGRRWGGVIVNALHPPPFYFFYFLYRFFPLVFFDFVMLCLLLCFCTPVWTKEGR